MYSIQERKNLTAIKDSVKVEENLSPVSRKFSVGISKKERFQHSYRSTPAVLRHLREANGGKRSGLWAENLWIFHHNNLAPHSSLIVIEFLVKQET